MERNSPQNKSELLFGIRPIIEAIEAGKEIDKILIQKEQSSPLMNELLQAAFHHKVPVQRVPVEKLNRITKKNHQGAICFMSSIVYASLDNVISDCFQSGAVPLILVLDRITDVRNFGAIARTAECMGVHAIVIPAKGAAQINSDAVKTSAGALNHIPVCREESLMKTIKYLKESGLSVVACTEKAQKTIADAVYNDPVAIVMGSEEDGISDEIIKKADEIVRIPMVGKIGSLNVSVAAGMILYEAIRQRGL
ncbi:MAG: 23S rRNA (guanosine(2251)-2'-O)-methyltransferase RlmB [Sporocytophaga sp.]|uniref:23S rRNA (guanosine(2251)-2'-O)-methyltransferase RlmB n=1 Tax=Sporocytophaga sp. TaxID=2231183 RepID=UPI001AFE2D7A|nr:23S rRNA (guanosine(2251)-2'-O)-methyltransferase RlmB [Sporocytophaga sp.]MBO9700040.1 23S rRNA (guanosine(2251)-2'-O)-methyltransferase RlmB [Sporocytophaga sp.]